MFAAILFAPICRFIFIAVAHLFCMQKGRHRKMQLQCNSVREMARDSAGQQERAAGPCPVWHKSTPSGSSSQWLT